MGEIIQMLFNLKKKKIFLDDQYLTIKCTLFSEMTWQKFLYKMYKVQYV